MTIADYRMQPAKIWAHLSRNQFMNPKFGQIVSSEEAVYKYLRVKFIGYVRGQGYDFTSKFECLSVNLGAMNVCKFVTFIFFY